MSTRFLLSSLILGLAVQSSSAQSCPVNGPLYYDYNLGVCNTAPDDTSFLANIFRQAQEYPVDNVVNVVALYRDSGGVVRRVTGFPQSTFARDGRNEVTFSFPVAISNIPNGAAVTKYLAITDTVKKCTWFGTAAYTQTHIPTITSTVSYTTVTGTSTSTTTSTTTLIETDSTTTTPPTLTATSVTGFKTVWAKRATTVTTSTFTPKPWTKHVVSWTKTTTTVSCLPGPRKRDIDTNSPQPEPRLDRRQGPIYAEPDCDGWFPLQTVYTDTIIVPASTTTTVNEVAIATTTTTITVEAPTPTSYTSVRGTTTVTPTRTITRWSILRPSIITSTKSFTFTVTKFPGRGFPKRCPTTITKPNGPICTPHRGP